MNQNNSFMGYSNMPINNNHSNPNPNHNINYSLNQINPSNLQDNISSNFNQAQINHPLAHSQYSNNFISNNQNYMPQVQHPTSSFIAQTQPSFNQNFQTEQRMAEKQKVNNLLQEMLNNVKNRETKTSDTTLGNIHLLYSVDKKFRDQICVLIRQRYNKNIKYDQVNIDTIKFLLENNKDELLFLYDNHKNSIN